MTRGSVSLSCANTQHFPSFRDLNGSSHLLLYNIMLFIFHITNKYIIQVFFEVTLE